MKYIRTKDGRLFKVLDCKVEWNEEVFDNETRWYIGEDEQSDNYYLIENQIDRVADTIEELCDEFVIDYKLVERHQFLGKIKITEMAKVLLSGKRVYGAIWTDKGLIYVAKMNDKGELELL